MPLSQHRLQEDQERYKVISSWDETHQIESVSPRSPRVWGLYQRLMATKLLQEDTSASLSRLMVDSQEWEALKIKAILSEEDGPKTLVFHDADQTSELTSLLSEDPGADMQTELVALIKSIRQIIAKRKFGTLKIVLDHFANSDDLPPQKIIAAFRTSFAARRKVSSWDDIVSTAKSKLNLRGEQGDQLLRGL